jgi:hypothetical protein
MCYLQIFNRLLVKCEMATGTDIFALIFLIYPTGRRGGPNSVAQDTNNIHKKILYSVLLVVQRSTVISAP